MNVEEHEKLAAYLRSREYIAEGFGEMDELYQRLLVLSKIHSVPVQLLHERYGGEDTGSDSTNSLVSTAERAYTQLKQYGSTVAYGEYARLSSVAASAAIGIAPIVPIFSLLPFLAKEYLEEKQKEKLKKSIEKHLELLEDAVDAKVVVDDEGNVFIDDEKVPDGAIREILEEVAPLNTIDEVSKRILSLPKSIRVFAAIIVLPYTISIAANLTTPDIKGDVTTAEAQVNSRLKELNADSYRVVFAQNLNVRDQGNSSSEIINTIGRGTLIKVTNIRGSWLYVEYVDSTQNNIGVGWVHSNYVTLLR